MLAGERVELWSNGTVLRLNQIQTNQEGRYTCGAQNTVGRDESDTYVSVTGMNGWFWYFNGENNRFAEDSKVGIQIETLMEQRH